MGLSESPLTMGTGVSRFRRVLAGLLSQAQQEGREDELKLAVDEVKAELNGDFSGVTSFTPEADASAVQLRKPKVRGSSNPGSSSGAGASVAA
jgi:hypothetical protein